MANTVVERDAAQQRKFGETLIEFESNMRNCTKSMRAHIEEAKGSIQADNARAALDSILQLLDDIDSSLPGVAEFGTRQITLAKFIEEAEGFGFSR